MTTQLIVSLNVVTEDVSQGPRIVEALSRAGLGLALDGLTVTLQMCSHDFDDEEEVDSETPQDQGSNPA